MTPAQFEQECRAIADCSVRLRLSPAWAWVSSPSGDGYLVHTFEMPAPAPPSVANMGDDDDDDLWGSGDQSVDVTAELEDTGTLTRDIGAAAAAAAGVVRTELHVALSPVYTQPQLMFNLYRAGTDTNALLPHADVCALVEGWVTQQSDPPDINAVASSSAAVNAAAVTQTPAVTQQEHPVLGTPFYALHGCETAGLMLAMGHCEDDPGYVLGWLSLVAPLVRLKLPVQLAAAVVGVGRVDMAKR